MTVCNGEPDCCEHDMRALVVVDSEPRNKCLECGIEWPWTEELPVPQGAPCGSDIHDSRMPNEWGGPL